MAIKNKKNNQMKVIVEKDEAGYFVFCPALPGCQSQGSTFEEALKNIKEAIELYLETLSFKEKQSILRKREIFSAILDIAV